MKSFVLFYLACLIVLTGQAQWTSDPAVNTIVAGSGMDHTFPKIASAPNGDFFIASWREVSTNINYEMWLQRINHEGYPQWGADGFQISNQPCRTWLSDYALTVDQAGNALIAIEDMRGGTGFSHVSVYAVAPDGRAVWDTNGVQLSDDPYMAYSPTVCLTHSQNVLVAWNADAEARDSNQRWFIRIQKLTPDGDPLWPEPISVVGPDSSYIFPNLLPVGTDDFILVWQKKFERGVGVGREWYTYIYAMRYGPDGTATWPDAARICDHGDSAYVVAEFLKLMPVQNENQGVYVAWFEDRYKTLYSNIYIQQVDTSGQLIWPMNGVAVSPRNVGFDRVEPWMNLDPESQELFVFWDEYRPVGAFDSFGILGQKILQDGSLGWGNLGKTLAGFSIDSVWYVFGLKSCPDSKMAVLIDQEYDSIVGSDTLLFDQLFAAQTDTAGNLTWSSPRVLMAATNGTKFYPELSDLNQDIFVATWNENRSSPFWPEGVVYAQNISLDGKLGPLGIPVYPGDESTLLLYPNPTDQCSWLELRKPVSGEVDIQIYDPTGRLVKRMTVNQDVVSYTIRLNAETIPSGLYLVRVLINGDESRVKWVVLK
ncbi:MAG: T9SS C-terminal target domain-containing protein [Bacteroidetes bacterium]|nr:MAG: T9SS C-terminal target domain-containing protein [Bacteroidota bacterium]